MRYKFCLIWNKCDWAETATTRGFQTWVHKAFPCNQCWCEKSELCVVGAEYEEGLPWALVSEADYDLACSSCEQTVVIRDRATLSRVRAALWFDRRKKGSKTLPVMEGRGLRVDVKVGDQTLKAGDRLEPSNHTLDTHTFGLGTLVFPIIAIFWRIRNETFATHRNPLFTIPGFSVNRFVPDILHCVYLGVAQSWLGAAIWSLFKSDVWKLGSDQLNVMKFRSLLFSYYKKLKRPGITRVHMVTLPMLGTRSKAAPQPFKGAEAKHLIPFVVGLLQEHCGGGPQFLLQAGLNLVRWIELIDSQPLHMTTEAKVELRKVTVRFLFLGIRGGMRAIAKTHQMLHLVWDCLEAHGNPRFYLIF